MERFLVECLSCGERRTVAAGPTHAADECRRCGYVGWARADELDERARRLLRERPVEVRRPRLQAA